MKRGASKKRLTARKRSGKTKPAWASEASKDSAVERLIFSAFKGRPAYDHNNVVLARAIARAAVGKDATALDRLAAAIVLVASELHVANALNGAR